MGLFLPTLPGSDPGERSGLSLAGVALAHVGLLAALATLAPADRIAAALTPLTVRMIDLAPEAPPPAPPPPSKPQPRVEKPLAAPLPVIAAPQSSAAPSSFTVAPQPPAPAVAPPPVAQAAPTPAPELPVVAARFDADYLHNPKPSYPPASRRMGEEGKVLVRVFVGADGSAEKTELRAGSGFPRLDQAALDAVGKWRFVPARRGEQPVAAWVVVPIVFSLDS